MKRKTIYKLLSYIPFGILACIFVAALVAFNPVVAGALAYLVFCLVWAICWVNKAGKEI